MKLKLKPPGTKRSKLEYDGLLSNLGFNFNLRCYALRVIVDGYNAPLTAGNFVDLVQSGYYTAGAYTRYDFSSI